MCRENEDLEQNRVQMEKQTAAITREKEALQQEAIELAKRLEAVIQDKFMPKSHIDADTPIDKTLNFLHAFIAVSSGNLMMPPLHALIMLFSSFICSRSFFALSMLSAHAQEQHRMLMPSLTRPSTSCMPLLQ